MAYQSDMLSVMTGVSSRVSRQVALTGSATRSLPTLWGG
jgi:hypothetical protein